MPGFLTFSHFFFRFLATTVWVQGFILLPTRSSPSLYVRGENLQPHGPAILPSKITRLEYYQPRTPQGTDCTIRTIFRIYPGIFLCNLGRGQGDLISSFSFFLPTASNINQAQATIHRGPFLSEISFSFTIPVRLLPRSADPRRNM